MSTPQGSGDPSKSPSSEWSVQSANVLRVADELQRVAKRRPDAYAPLKAAIAGLKIEPRPAHATKINDNAYCITVDGWHLVYSVADSRHLVVIAGIVDGTVPTSDELEALFK